MLHRMGLIQLYATTMPSTTIISASTHSSTNGQDDSMSFCNCKKNENEKVRQHRTKPYYEICRCGEETCNTIEWEWDNKLIQPQTIVVGRNVSFHPSYSQGTSIVRGEWELQKNMIHYWEIKVVSWCPGTDLMIGIGTDLVDLFIHRYGFKSALGLDGHSWGYSYRGMKHHKGILKCYGKSFTSQCIVGVYLDLFKGHLEFYVNRIPQGNAYTDILLDNNRQIYPMVCSTSARSSVRLMNATSFKECLQFRCMKIIARYPQLLDKVRQMPGLSYLCKNLWYLMPKERYQYSQNCSTSSSNYYLDIDGIERDPDKDDDASEEIDCIDDASYMSL